MAVADTSKSALHLVENMIHSEDQTTIVPPVVADDASVATLILALGSIGIIEVDDS